jgi:hypothetical protein
MVFYPYIVIVSPHAALRGTFPTQGKSPAACVGLSLHRESLLQPAWDFPYTGKVSCNPAEYFPYTGKVSCNLRGTFPTQGEIKITDFIHLNIINL